MEASPVIVYEPIPRQTENLVGLFFLIHARSLAEARAAYHSTIQELAPESPETDSVRTQAAGRSAFCQFMLTIELLWSLGDFAGGADIRTIGSWSADKFMKPSWSSGPSH
jgi:hypothetical protein